MQSEAHLFFWLIELQDAIHLFDLICDPHPRRSTLVNLSLALLTTRSSPRTDESLSVSIELPQRAIEVQGLHLERFHLRSE